MAAIATLYFTMSVCLSVNDYSSSILDNVRLSVCYWLLAQVRAHITVLIILGVKLIKYLGVEKIFLRKLFWIRKYRIFRSKKNKKLGVKKSEEWKWINKGHWRFQITKVFTLHTNLNDPIPNCLVVYSKRVYCCPQETKGNCKNKDSAKSQNIIVPFVYIFLFR